MTDVSKMSDQELNWALEVAAFGHRLVEHTDEEGKPVWRIETTDGEWARTCQYEFTVDPEWGKQHLSRPFATDGNAMLSLLQSMQERGWDYCVESGMGDVYVTMLRPDSRVTHEGVVEIVRDSPMPRAVAEAVLLALMSEVKA